MGAHKTELHVTWANPRDGDDVDEAEARRACDGTTAKPLGPMRHALDMGVTTITHDGFRFACGSPDEAMTVIARLRTPARSFSIWQRILDP